VEHSNRLHEAHETLQSVLAQNDDNVIGHVVEFFRGYFSHFANEIYSCIRERAPEEIEIGDVLPAIADTDGFLHYLYGEEAMREKVARVSMRIHRPLERILRALAMYANYEQSMTGRVENSRENGFVDIDLTEGKYKWETRKAEEEIYAGRTIRVIRLNQRDRPYTVAVLAPHGDVAEIVTRIASDRSFRDHIERIAERHIKELRTINSNLRRAGWVPDLFEGS
jgi:acyl-CoA-binding protein